MEGIREGKERGLRRKKRVESKTDLGMNIVKNGNGRRGDKETIKENATESGKNHVDLG